MKTFALTQENISAFSPLLPDENIIPDLDAGLIVLGAALENAAGQLQACGTLILEAADEDTWFLRWLLVSPEYRRQGTGSALMELAMEVAAALDMQLYCVFSGVPGEEHTPLYTLLEKHGFVIRPREAKSYAVSLEEMAGEEFFRRESRPGPGVMLLKDAPSSVITAMNRDLEQRGLLYVDPISTQWALGDISLICTDKDAAVACVIFDRIDENTLRLAYVHADGKASMRLPMLLLQANKLLQDNFSPDTQLVIPCVSESSRKLAEKLLPCAWVTLETYSAQAKPEFDTN